MLRLRTAEICMQYAELVAVIVLWVDKVPYCTPCRFHAPQAGHGNPTYDSMHVQSSHKQRTVPQFSGTVYAYSAHMTDRGTMFVCRMTCACLLAVLSALC